MKHVDLVIIGQNYSTSLGLIQAAGEAGFTVGVIHYSAHRTSHLPLEFKSKYVIKHFIANRQNERALLDILIEWFACDSKKSVLLPSDDYCSALIDRNSSVLKEFFHVPTINSMSDETAHSMDKSFQLRKAIEAGLSTAHCWSVELDGKRPIDLPDGLSFPCITKPLKSIGSSKSFIRCCENKDDLRKALEEINRSRPCPILIEELINIDAEYTIPVLAMGKEILIPAFLRKTRVGSETHKGVTITGSVISSSRFIDIVAGLKRLIRNMGLQGIFDIELLRSGDAFYFNEINLRYGAAGYALTRAGINMPALWIEYCLGRQPKVGNLSFKEGLSFVSDKAALDDFRAGYLSWNDYRRIVSSADFRFLIDNPDTSVVRGFRMIEIKAFLSRLLMR